MNKTKLLIVLVALAAIVVIRMWAIAEPKLWLSGYVFPLDFTGLGN